MIAERYVASGSCTGALNPRARGTRPTSDHGCRRSTRGPTPAKLFVLAVSLFASSACAQILGLDTAAHSSTRSSSETSSASGGAASGAGGACGSCAPSTDCLASVCSDGGCSFAPEVAGESCPTGVCDGAGACVECLVEGDCASSEMCDSTLHQCLPKKTLGVACSSASECLLSHCVGSGPENKVCCTSVCSGDCESCSESETGMPNGTCAPVLAGTDPKGDCASRVCGTNACDGNGACGVAPEGVFCSRPMCFGTAFGPPDRCDASGQCVTTLAIACPGRLVCDPATDACLAACSTKADCMSGSYCAAPTCLAQKANSATCSIDDECSSGNCQSGKCKP